jgi:signal transduction histidine kinase
VVKSTARYSTLAVQLNADTEVVVMADPIRITQVMDNLLSNAVKYAPGSPVSISLKNHADTCMLTVEDHGPGIAQEHLEHLFDRFFRVPETRNNARGTGLGLYICQQIIHEHRGEITVTSELSKGTKFCVALPCASENEPDLGSEKENRG